MARLDERVFKELNLSVVDSVRAGDGSGINDRSMPVVKLDEIDLSGYKILNAAALMRNYNARPGTDRVDGAIGLPFFKDAVVELNFEKNILTISHGKLSTADGNIVSFRFNNGVPKIPLMLGEKEMEADFDTGNMGGLTFHSSDVPAAIVKSEPRVVGTAKTATNTFEIKEASLTVPVKIGNLVFDNPVIGMNDVLPHANIGIRFSKQLNITIDVSGKLMKFEKYNKQKRELASSGSSVNEYTGGYEGGRQVTTGTDGFLYIQRPNGIKLKMIVKAKDEFTLEAVPSAVIKFLRNEAGKVMGVKVSRDNGTTWEEAKRL